MIRRLLSTTLVWAALSGAATAQQNPHVKAYETELAELRKSAHTEQQMTLARFNSAAAECKAKLLESLEKQRLESMQIDDLDAAIALRDLVNLLKAAEIPGIDDAPTVAKPLASAKIFQGHRYAIIDTPTTWHLAAEFAKSRGGYLARIGSPEEYEFIKAMCRRDNFAAYWIDGTDEAKEGTWLYSNGQKADLDLVWGKQSDKNRPPVPDNSQGWEHHVELTRDWDLQANDVPSGLRRRFIVEWE